MQEHGGGSGRGRVVVITGASAGVGRATARAFARAGRASACWPGAATGWRRRAATSRTLGGRALVLPTDVADPDQVEAAAAAVERAFGPIDVWVNNAMVSVFSPVKQMEPEEYRRVTEVTYLGYVYGTLAALRRMLPRDRGIDRPGRLGAGLPRHPAPVGLLRGQARDPGLLRLAPLRADPRRQPRPADDGADAGAEHAAVRLGQEPAAAQGAAGAADLPARGRRRGDRLGGRPRPPRDRWSAGRPSRRSSATRSPRAGSTHYLARTGYDAQKTDEPEDPDRPDNLWEPVARRPRRARDASTTVASDRAGSSGPTCTAAGSPRPAAAWPGWPSPPSSPAAADRSEGRRAGTVRHRARDRRHPIVSGAFQESSGSRTLREDARLRAIARPISGPGPSRR